MKNPLSSLEQKLRLQDILKSEIYDTVDNILYNLDHLTDNECIKFAEIIIYKKMINHPLYLLADRLSKIKVEPDPVFPFLNLHSVKELIEKIMKIENDKIKNV